MYQLQNSTPVPDHHGMCQSMRLNDIILSFVYLLICPQTKLLMALRRQLGDEDFYTIFDPRNPVIGEL